jgi:hypothetical protein
VSQPHNPNWPQYRGADRSIAQAFEQTRKNFALLREDGLVKITAKATQPGHYFGVELGGRTGTDGTIAVPTDFGFDVGGRQILLVNLEDTIDWQIPIGKRIVANRRPGINNDSVYFVNYGVMGGTPANTPPPGPGTDILNVIYDWTANARVDLDTGTKFLGKDAGWSCLNDPTATSYLDWFGDNTNANGSEQCNVDLGRALSDGKWVANTTVYCNAHWYNNGANLSDVVNPFTFVLRAIFRGVTHTANITQNTIAGGAATEQVAHIDVSSTGAFSIVVP